MFDDVYPLYPARAIHRLDGIWDFNWLGDMANDDVDPQSLVYDDVQAVPGVFDTGLDLCNVRGVGVYRREVVCAGGAMRVVIAGLGLY